MLAHSTVCAITRPVSILHRHTVPGIRLYVVLVTGGHHTASNPAPKRCTMAYIGGKAGQVHPPGTCPALSPTPHIPHSAMARGHSLTAAESILDAPQAFRSEAEPVAPPRLRSKVAHRVGRYPAPEQRAVHAHRHILCEPPCIA